MCPTLCSEDAGSPERPTVVSSPQKTPSRPNRALQQLALVRSATPLHRLKEDKLFLPIHCYDLNHRLPGKPRRQMKPEGGILLKQALSVCRWPWRTPCPLPAPSVPGDCGASQVGLRPQTSVGVGGWTRLSRSLKMPRISLVVLSCFCVRILSKKTQARPEAFTCCWQRKAGMCNPGRHQSLPARVLLKRRLTTC